jgi:hypothetical protein
LRAIVPTMTFSSSSDEGVALLPPSSFERLAEAVGTFAEAAEDLLGGDLGYPFAIGSDALHDCAADELHQGTRSKTSLTNLATAQIRAGFVQCDLHRGIAAALHAPKVFFSPFVLARTCVVVAAKAWSVLNAGTLEQRLQRYLNEELAALHDAPFDPDREESRSYVNECTDDYVAIGGTAGLRLGCRKNPKPWDAPFLVRPDEPDTQTPLSETRLVRSLIEESGFGRDSYAGLPYSLLSAATHGRFHHAGVTAYAPLGPAQGSVVVSSFHAPVDVTAQVTIHAAFATLTYLLALARYTKVTETLVRERLRASMIEWNAVAQSK